MTSRMATACVAMSASIGAIRKDQGRQEDIEAEMVNRSGCGGDQDRPAPGLDHGPKVETGGRQEHRLLGRARREDEGEPPRVGSGRQGQGGHGHEEAAEGGKGATARAGHPGSLDARQATRPSRRFP